MALPDSNLFDRLTVLAACLCATITADGLPEPCFCGILPGSEVAGDYAGSCPQKCGMAWVRLVNVYPSTALGEPSLIPGNCGSGFGFDVEIGILRCVPVGNSAGAPPTPAQMLAATQLQVADMHAMFKAALCCDGVDPKDVIAGTYEPVGPEGGLVGGTIIVQYAV